MSPRHDSRFCSLRRMLTALGAAAGLVVSNAAAQPQVISLGRGGPNSAAPGPSGSYILGGVGISSSAAGYWTLNGTALSIAEAAGTGTGAGYLSADGAYAAVIISNSTPPRVFGNTATNVSPPFSMNPTLVPSTTNPQATEFRAARWNLATNTIQDMGGLPIVPELMVYGSGSSGGSTGTFITPNAISSTGRFIVGQAYISSYNSSAGTTISDNTFHWRAFIWDAEANGGLGAYTIMPTPFRTSTNTWRRRTGAAFAVSSDGLVVLGAQEHNVSTTPTADPDGARLVVWRWDAGTSQYVMTYLPNGVNGSGFPYTLSVTARSVHMNAAGTMIVAMAVDDTSSTYLAKWTWDAGTSTWNAPQNLGSGLESEATWLPGSVTTCGVPPIITPTGMSDDGNTIIGSARYSTCGSFMTGGFIWTSASNSLVDWYDYLVAQGSTDVTAYYGPTGDGGDPTRGLPKIGSPLGITADGSAIVGSVLGPQLIAGAPPTLILPAGGP
ncbi:MAG: hypothetical protein HZB38_13295, partial [Planctomycetes bacterium]|nr:hypothetical protein [Planctomycetota bacterium]